MRARRKRIYFGLKSKKYVVCFLFADKKEMNEDYWKFNEDGNTDEVRGAHCPYEKQLLKDGKWITSKEIGRVYLCVNDSGAGIVSHEFLHAALWAYKHKGKFKRQYPIVLKNMQEEETLLRMHTHAVTSFYNWYWKVVEQVKNVKKNVK